MVYVHIKPHENVIIYSIERLCCPNRKPGGNGWSNQTEPSRIITTASSKCHRANPTFTLQKQTVVNDKHIKYRKRKIYHPDAVFMRVKEKWAIEMLTKPTL